VKKNTEEMQDRGENVGSRSWWKGPLWQARRILCSDQCSRPAEMPGTSTAQPAITMDERGGGGRGDRMCSDHDR